VPGGVTYVAANTTVALNSTPRGFPCNESDNAYNCPHTLVTPAVASVTNQHFACPSMVRAVVHDCCPLYRATAGVDHRHTAFVSPCT
jgi:hypothetical protein